MSPLYSPYDASTFLILEGDTARYLDLAATAGTFDAATMALGFDDSAWTAAPQPFVLNNDGWFTSSVWDDFGVEYNGPHSGSPPVGYTSPNADRFAGTAIGDDGSGFAEVAVRLPYTIPPRIPAPFNVDATKWLALFIWAGRQAVYVDGALLATFTGSGRAGQHLTSSFASAITPGSHVLGLHGQGTASNHALFSALVGVGTQLTKNLPRLRQFPRDDGLGNAPRPGRESTSVQATARQGWAGTYR